MDAVARAVMALLDHYGWSRVVVICDQLTKGGLNNTAERESCKAIIETVKQRKGRTQILIINIDSSFHTDYAGMLKEATKHSSGEASSQKHKSGHGASGSRIEPTDQSNN